MIFPPPHPECWDDKCVPCIMPKAPRPTKRPLGYFLNCYAQAHLNSLRLTWWKLPLTLTRVLTLDKPFRCSGSTVGVWGYLFLRILLEDVLGWRLLSKSVVTGALIVCHSLKLTGPLWSLVYVLKNIRSVRQGNKSKDQRRGLLGCPL